MKTVQYLLCPWYSSHN